MDHHRTVASSWSTLKEIDDAYREECADGDMNACSELYSRSPYGSNDERFALDGLCAGCAEGEMVGCDLLYHQNLSI